MTTLPILMSDHRYSKIEELVLKSYPNACLLYIDEVVNLHLYEKFLARKERIKATEVQMFHGTHEKNIDPIIKNGFDPSLNVRKAFGPGVYFADHASYSSAYMTSSKPGEPTFMFLADVLVGKIGVDNHKGPNMLTTVHEDGAFPRYIIAFHKNAK
jgi:hypothetical protein